jgi:hypothetical protein
MEKKFEFSKKKEIKQVDTENFSIEELQKYYQEFMLKYNGKNNYKIAIEDDMKDLQEKQKEGILSLEEKNKLLEEINNLVKDLKEDYKLNVNFLTAHDKQKYLSVSSEMILAN